MTGRIYTAAEKYEAASRELKFRVRVFERRVALEKMTQAKADYEIAIMAAIADDYKTQAETERLI